MDSISRNRFLYNQTPFRSRALRINLSFSSLNQIQKAGRETRTEWERIIFFRFRDTCAAEG